MLLQNHEKNILNINGLQTETILGVYDWERQAPRPVIINLKIGIDISKAAKTDNIADTLDYAELIDKLDKHIRSCHFQLIEALAENISDFIFQNALCEYLWLEVIKPNIIKQVKQISICIERHR